MAIAATNEQPGIGHNEAPDYATAVVDRLKLDYAELFVSVATVLDEARVLPKVIDTEDQLNTVSAVIKRLRDLSKRAEAYHGAEKEPYLRGGQAVDQTFFGVMDKLSRRNPKNNPGAADILDARVDDHMQRKLAAERAERERIAAEEQRKAAEEQAKIDAANRAAEEAAAKAARARNAEKIAEHQAEADRQRRIADENRAAAALAAQAAEDARIETLASAADMVRTRLEGGALATMGTVPLVKIDDVTLLDKATLWPFLKEEHILMALKAWAKTKSHKTPMAGATIKLVNKGQVR